MRRMVLAGCVAASASAAAAGCPTAADMAAGVRLDFEDGLSMTMTRRADGVVEQRIPDAEEPGLVHLADYAAGLFFVAGARLLPDGGRSDPMATRYEDPLPAIRPGAAFALRSVTSYEGMETPGESEVRVEAAERIDIGGCAYEALPVVFTILAEGNPYESRMAYLPELGFAFVASADVFDGDPVEYRPARIAALGR